MAEITLRGNPIHTVGTLPETGATAKDFALVGQDLANKTLADFGGKKKVLNIYPSVDTPVCAASTRQFHTKLASRDDVVVLNISADLPFAVKRFCASEGIENAHHLSTFRGSTFGRDYGVEMSDGPLAGLMSRAVVILDENNKVTYTEQVPEIGQEPDYDAAVKSL